ncbi:MAG: hypothetical protein ACTSWQ_04975 [Candidatus Thorarchaeota archaeon]
MSDDRVDISARPDLYMPVLIQDRLMNLQKQIGDINSVVSSNKKWLERIDKEKEHSISKKRLDIMLYGIIVTFLVSIAGIGLTLWQLSMP